MKKHLLFVMVVFIVVTFSSCEKEMDSTNNVIPKNVLQNPFVIKHFPEGKAPRWFEKVKKVAKADALGFVSGAIGSVISGHAAATMTFEPHGTVAVIAGDATVGAITSSGVAVVGQIVTP